MTRVMLGLLIGLSVGSVASIGAQKPAEPCAHTWILWRSWTELTSQGNASDGWEAEQAYPTFERCIARARVRPDESEKAYRAKLGDGVSGVISVHREKDVARNEDTVFVTTQLSALDHRIDRAA
jgi:hypothetical protein